MSIIENCIGKSLGLLTRSLDNADTFGANAACHRIERHAPGELAQAIGHCLWESVDDIFDRDVEKDEIDVQNRIDYIPSVFETCVVAVSVASNHGAIAELKEQALLSAKSLLGGVKALERLAIHPHFVIGDSNVDHGQRRFIFAICLAVALDQAGAGLDSQEMREFSWSFREWIDHDKARMSDACNLLFGNSKKAVESAFFDKEAYSDDFMHLSTFMAAMRAAISARKIDLATREVSCPDIRARGAVRRAL